MYMCAAGQDGNREMRSPVTGKRTLAIMLFGYYGKPLLEMALLEVHSRYACFLLLPGLESLPVIIAICHVKLASTVTL